MCYIMINVGILLTISLEKLKIEKAIRTALLEYMRLLISVITYIWDEMHNIY